MNIYTVLEDQVFFKKVAWTCVHVKVQVACSDNYPGAPLKMPFMSVGFVMQGLT